MEKAAGTLADILVKKSVVEKADRDFYRYAIETVLIYAVNFAAMFILAAVTGKLPELALLLAVLYPLRQSCGGKHMNTWYGCYVVSCSVFEATLLISGMIHMHIAVMAAITAVCISCIWRFAPVEHHNHILDKQDFIQNKKRARILSMSIAAAAFIFKLLGFEVGAVICVSSEVLCSVLLLLGVLEEKRYLTSDKKLGG